MKAGKKGLKAILIAILLIGLCSLAGAAEVPAAPSNTRGRIAINLDDFVYVGHSGGRSHGLEKSGSGYKLHFNNYMFSNHNNDGVTYRSSGTYDMTDVIKMEYYSYTQTDNSHKFLIYTTANSNITYHSRDYDSVTESMYANSSPTVDGDVLAFSAVSIPTSRYTWASDYFGKAFNVTDSYEQRYIYVGMSHGFAWQDATIYLGNSTYSEAGSGSIALRLKEHKVTLLDAEVQRRIDENNVERDYTAFLNLQISLNDGQTYTTGMTGSVYRDEKIVLNYSYVEPYSVTLKQIKIYSDSEKKNLLYTIDCESKASTTGTGINTITLTSDLIQKIEKESGQDLGNFYLEPVFEAKKVDIVVRETAMDANNENIASVASLGISEDSNQYVVYEGSASEPIIIGYLNLNNASRIGDYLRIDYEPNREYSGENGVSKIYLRYCDTADGIDSTSNTAWFEPDSVLVDYNEKIENSCIGIIVQMGTRAVLRLEDKTTVYNGKTVKIDPATVTYSLDSVKPKYLNDIEYYYYSSYEDALAGTNRLESAPINAGTYYVKALMEGDKNYIDSESNIATLTIEKATPTIEKAIGTTIQYGQQLSDSDFIETNVKVTGVSGQKISGEMKWLEPELYPAVGLFVPQKIKFIVSEKYAANYKHYEDVDTSSGRVTVQPVGVDIIFEDGAYVYSGETTVMETAEVYLKNTEQKVDSELSYTYYSDEECKKELENGAIDTGTYYVKADIACDEFYSTKDAVAKMEITPASAGLIHNMRLSECEVQVVGCIGDDVPSGSITIQVIVNGEVVNELTERIVDRHGDRNPSAIYSLDEMTKDVPSDVEYTVIASYVPDTSVVQNYEIESSEMIYKNTDRTLVKTITLTYGEQQTFTCYWNEDFFGENPWTEEDDIEITWPYKNYAGCLSMTDLDSTKLNGGFKFTVTCDGKAYMIGRLVEKNGDRETVYYLMYKITVESGPIDVELPDKTVTFNGEGVKMDGLIVTGPNSSGEIVTIEDGFGSKGGNRSYDYYYDEDCTQKLAYGELPVEVGTYYVVGNVRDLSKYVDGRSNVAKLVIDGAVPLISMEDQTVTFDGTAKTLEAVVDASVEGYPVTGEVEYTYKNLATGKIVEQAIDAGIYEVTATVTEDGNYKSATTTATLVIERAEVITMKAEDVTTVYNGEPVPMKLVEFEDENGNTEIPEEVYYQYLKVGDTNDHVTENAPVNAGVYYARAVLEGNYKTTYSNNVVITIEKAQPEVTIPEQILVEYTGNSISVDSAVVTVYDKEVTDQFEVIYTYYTGEDQKVMIDPPTEPGTYYVKAHVAEQENYYSAESDYQTMIIWEREKADVTLTLKNKFVTYGGTAVEIEPASVQYDESAGTPENLDNIVYTYYGSLQDVLHKQNPLSGAPVNAGIYYVYASMEEDDNFVYTRSNIAILVIEKAVPVINKAVGTTITYGQPLSESVFTSENVSAEGVLGEAISGTFEWVEPTVVLDAGYQSAKIKFTVSEEYAVNYTDYEDSDTKSGRVQVDAASTRIEYKDGTFDYTGYTYPMETAKVYLGDTDEEMDLTLTYAYYNDAECTDQLSGAPVDAGTYYAMASTSGNGNYGAASAVAKIVINPIRAGLVQVPLNQAAIEDTYRVYISNILDALPNGTIKLTISGPNGETKELEAQIERNSSTGKVYAGFDYSEVTSDISDGTEFTVKASYVPDTSKPQNYIVADDETTLHKGATSLVIDVELTYGEDYQEIYYWDEKALGQELYDDASNVNVVWLYQNENSDVVDTVFNDKNSVSGSVTFTVKNEGRAYVLGYMRETGATATNSYYIVFSITVNPAPVEVTLSDKTTEFNGSAVEIGKASVSGPDVNGDTIDLTGSLGIQYHYYTDAKCTQELETGKLPTEAGTYYVMAETTATRNYKAGKSAPAKIVIEPTDPILKLKNQIVTYDGESHMLETVLESTVADYPITGKETCKYTNSDGEEIEEPVEIGIYEVEATLAADGNYNGATATGILVIEQLDVTELVVKGITKVYDGIPATITITKFEDENGNTEIPDDVIYLYRNAAEVSAEYTEEPPVDAGVYSAKAVILENGIYKWVSSNEVIVTIEKAQPVVTIPQEIKIEYTGDVVAADSAVVTVDGKTMTANFKITYKYYTGNDEKQEIETPTEPGTYYVKAFVEEEKNYNAAESDYQILTIWKAADSGDNPGGDDGTGEEDNPETIIPGNDDSGNSDSGTTNSGTTNSGTTNSGTTSTDGTTTIETGDNTSFIRYLAVAFLGLATIILTGRRRSR